MTTEDKGVVGPPGEAAALAPSAFVVLLCDRHAQFQYGVTTALWIGGLIFAVVGDVGFGAVMLAFAFYNTLWDISRTPEWLRWARQERYWKRRDADRARAAAKE